MKRRIFFAICTWMLGIGYISAQEVVNPGALTREQVDTAYAKVLAHGCKPAAFVPPRYFGMVIKQDPIARTKEMGIARGSYSQFSRNFALRFPEKTSDADLQRLAPSLKNLPNLNAVDLGGCKGVSDAGCKVLKQLADLRIVYLDGTKITDNGVRELTENAQMLWLELARTDISDSALADINRCKNLMGLGLAGNPKITDRGVNQLGNLKLLRTLDLSDTGVTCENIPDLATMTMLSKLFVAGTPISDSALSSVARFRSLEALDLSRTSIRGSGLSALVNLKMFRKLYLTDVPIDARGATAIGTLKQIQELHLNNSRPIKAKQSPAESAIIPVKDELLPALADCTSLGVLDLSWTAITGETIKELAPLQTLHEIRLEGAPVKGSVFEGLAQMKSLRSIDLSRTQISGLGIQQLSDNPNLESLKLEGSSIEDNGAKGLGQIKTLKVLDVSQTGLTASGLNEIGSLSLIQLDMSRTRVGTSIVKTLSGMKTLRVVDLRQTEAGEPAAVALRKAIPTCTVIATQKEVVAKDALVPRFPAD